MLVSRCRQPPKGQPEMVVSRRRPTHAPQVLCLVVATLLLAFAACTSTATPEPGRGSGLTSSQAKPITQEPTSHAAASGNEAQTPTIPKPTSSLAAVPDTGARTPVISIPTPSPATVPDRWVGTPTIRAPTPSHEAAKHHEATTVPSPARHSNNPFIQVSAGFHHSCGLRADGAITCWGAHGEDERLTESAGLIDSPPGSFSQIDAGHHHSCAIHQDGAVKCWGSMSIEGGDIPPETKAMMEAMWAPPEGRFMSVSAGFLFSCGVRDDHTAECWGLAASLSDALTPPDGEYTLVSVGGFHACGIRTDRTVVCWGGNQGFDGDFLGQATPPDGPFEVINAGGYHTCGFRPDGEIRCWGSIVGGYLQTCEP